MYFDLNEFIGEQTHRLFLPRQEQIELSPKPALNPGWFWCVTGRLLQLKNHLLQGAITVFNCYRDDATIGLVTSYDREDFNAVAQGGKTVQTVRSLLDRLLHPGLPTAKRRRGAPFRPWRHI